MVKEQEMETQYFMKKEVPLFFHIIIIYDENIFLREVVLLYEEENKVEIHKSKKNKLPFAVFITPNNKSIHVVEDYKEIFTDIISDRIKQKYQ